MEADFDVAMQLLLGHGMICNVIKNRAIPQECFGSCPEHMAIQVSLNWCLKVDVSQQHCSMLAITLVDCLTCYDSIAHPPASLTCQCRGVPPSILCTVFKTIQLMKGFLHMAKEDSFSYYGGGFTPLPSQRVCQYNDTGPTIWLATSIVLMNMVLTTATPFHSALPSCTTWPTCWVYCTLMIVIYLQPTPMVYTLGLPLPNFNVILTFGKEVWPWPVAPSPLQSPLGSSWQWDHRVHSGHCIQASPSWPT